MENIEKSKRSFIKDPIWGHIEIFPWEGSILENSIFNRLHDIIQNSCAYLVYPGLKHSRFLHSVGTLHVSTEIFTNCILNTEQDILKELLLEKDLIEEVFESNMEMKEQLKKTICARTKCSQDYALLLAVVRASALLHDMGHLPYSHVFEFMLFSFRKLQSEDIPEDTQKIHNDLKEIFGKEKPHEIIGTKLIGLMLSYINQGSVLEKILQGTLMLWGEDNKMPICKSMLSADVDADRIDFVRRDGMFSGLYTSSIDFERLFSFYELARDGKDEKEDAQQELSYFSNIGKQKQLPKIRARPSSRATAETEKILWERFLSYKYIASHHKVHLFDEILERLLLKCATHGLLDDLLKQLPIICNPSKSDGSRSIKERSDVIIAITSFFNDSWINERLNVLYSDANAVLHNGKTNDANNKIAKLEKYESEYGAKRIVRLYEGLSEKRSLFKSLFKQDEDYFNKFPITRAIPAMIAVQQNKYNWEKELEKNLGTTVIVGDLTKKLTSGFGIESPPGQFLGLEELAEFLLRKIQKSRPLNVWYYLPPKESREKEKEYRDKIIFYLRKELYS